MIAVREPKRKEFITIKIYLKFINAARETSEYRPNTLRSVALSKWSATIPNGAATEQTWTTGTNKGWGSLCDRLTIYTWGHDETSATAGGHDDVASGVHACVAARRDID